MPVLVVMGVCGCGKSTLGKALATALQCAFVEGDDLHPPANITKMTSGQALDDADRAQFLENAGKVLASNTAVVVSCSALKLSYRDLLRRYAHHCRFVLPLPNRQILLDRLQKRSAHFMGAAMLDSQLAILELPGKDEKALVLSGAQSTSDCVDQVLAWLETEQNNQ